VPAFKIETIDGENVSWKQVWVEIDQPRGRIGSPVGLRAVAEVFETRAREPHLVEAHGAPLPRRRLRLEPDLG